MRLTWFSRAISSLGIVVALVVVLGAEPGGAAESPPLEQSVCFDGALARTRTEVDTDVTVPQFEAALGTLLGVSVSGPSVHLDTDAVFESTAGSAVVFAENMDYQLAFTSPGGLTSPPAVTGMIQRVPSQTLAAFDGTLDFLGASAVTQPQTTRDEAASDVASADAPVLSAFTGAGTMPFHVATTISETFMGGGGNVQFQINTFVSAEVRVCYRYAPPPQVVPEIPPPPPPPPAAPPEPVPTLPATGSTSAPLAAAGVLMTVFGAALAWRGRAPRPRLDG